MTEAKKWIPGYENLYEITVSGRVYSHYKKEFLTRCNDEYGFHIVTLYKKGEKKNHNLFDIWKETYRSIGLQEHEFKGARKAIYK